MIFRILQYSTIFKIESIYIVFEFLSNPLPQVRARDKF